MHLFLSPHLDDVVLSCGATIASLTRQGEKVVILTAMAGEPPAVLPDTEVVRTLQSRLSAVQKAILVRRMEDAQAAHCLGVQVYHLAVVDGAFRTCRGRDGRVALYPTSASLTGDIHSMDEARISLLAMPLPFKDKITTIYAPMGVGHHVDHQLVRDWGLVLRGAQGGHEVKFYAEYPAVQDRPTFERARQYYADTLPALKLRTLVINVDEAEFALKLKALRCYVSRLNPTWNEQQEIAMRQWMLANGSGTLAERIYELLTDRQFKTRTLEARQLKL